MHDAGSLSLSDSNVVDESQVADSLKQMRGAQEKILEQLGKLIVGQEEVVNQLLICLFVGGHSLITGLPGLAKTLLVHSLSRTLGLSFNRIQFTPDLMPADIIGTEIIEEDRSTGSRRFRFVKGPIFANLILADEINRTPPKTQAALLEAMQERHVTVAGQTHVLSPPFFVFATQNPIELEGTYPLPEAQLDRFMFNIVIDYLDEEDEVSVVNQTTGLPLEELDKVVSSEELLKYQSAVRTIAVGEEVTRYAVNLSRATRPVQASAPDFVSRWVAYGSSLRASQYLVLGGKARAILAGRYNVSVEDIQALAKPVLRHRIITNFHAESEKVTTDDVVSRLLETVPVPRSGLQ